MKILKVIKMRNILKVSKTIKALKVINGHGYYFKVSKASISNTRDLLTLNNSRSGSYPVDGVSWQKNQPSSLAAVLQCKRSSMSICTTPSTDVIGV